MAGFTVILNPTLQPICDPATCTHPVENRIAVNSRVEKGKRGRQGIVMDATFCLCCGAELIGNMPWGVAFQRFWDRFGWHAKIGGRAWELMNLRAHDGSLSWPQDGTERLGNGKKLVPVELMTWCDQPQATAQQS